MGRYIARASTTVALVGIAAVAASVQARLPRAPGAHVVTITPQGQIGSEPAIAVNPANPSQVVGVAGRWAAFSTDGARTFTPVQPSGEDGRSGGDPSLAFDDKGHLFLSFLSIQRNGLPGYWGHGPGGNGICIYVRHSADGGRTWDKEPVAVIAWTGNEPDVKLEDMPGDYEWCTAYGGRVYGIWAEAAPEGYEVTPSGRGTAAPARPRTPTIIRVGTADFRKPT